jgi:hypothetical protein
MHDSRMSLDLVRQKEVIELMNATRCFRNGTGRQVG